jgi:hypothetical protein
MSRVNVWQQEARIDEGSIVLEAIVENADAEGSRHSLWYRIPEQYSELLTSSCDPFIVAILFKCMAAKKDLVAHGQLSPSLLQNLTEFQSVWHCWQPQKYRPIEITAEIEAEETTSLTSEKTISSFSGGVDSCFTAFRHRQKLCGRGNRNLQACLMVHGFDIPLKQPDIFDRAFQNSQRMLDSLDVELIPIATNFRSLRQSWEDSYGTGLASCFLLLQQGFNRALIPSGEPYDRLPQFWGTHPITNHMLSNDNLKITHDGTAFSRLDKINVLAQWPEAMNSLRVCWEGRDKDRNCGQCEKCIRTMLGFRALGYEIPQCFPHDVTIDRILNLTAKTLNKPQKIELELVLERAKANRITESWVKTLEIALGTNAVLENLQVFKLKPLKNKFFPAKSS